MKPERDPEGIEIEFLQKTGGVTGRKVLEIGCGDGRLIRRYAASAALVVGVDPDAEKLAEALQQAAGSRPQQPLILAQSQAEDLPFADAAFESVLLAWSL